MLWRFPCTKFLEVIGVIYNLVRRIERRYEKANDAPKTPEYNRIFRKMFHVLSESIDQHRPSRLNLDQVVQNSGQLRSTSPGSTNRSIPSISRDTSINNICQRASQSGTPTRDLPKTLPNSARLFSQSSVGKSYRFQK